jgi:hypothetical protein
MLNLSELPYCINEIAKSKNFIKIAKFTYSFDIKNREDVFAKLLFEYKFRKNEPNLSPSELFESIIR